MHTEPRTTPDRWVSAVSLWLRLALGAIVVAGLGLLLVRDAWPAPWCTFYYALPRPILLIAALAIGWLSCGRDRRLSAVSLGLSLLLAGWMLGADFVWNPVAITPTTGKIWRIATWNAGHLPRGRAVAARTMLAWDADVIGVVESGPSDERSLAEWRELLPGYTVVSPRSGLLWVARGKIEPLADQTLSHRSEVAAATVSFGADTLNVVLVSLTSDPFQQRAEPLRALVRFLDSLAQPPAIVMGDFNTPGDSVWWSEFQRHRRNAFADHGRGHCPTWPSFCPVLELDYLWVSSPAWVHNCWQGWTWASDHQPVLAEIVISQSPRGNEPLAVMRSGLP